MHGVARSLFRPPQPLLQKERERTGCYELAEHALIVALSPPPCPIPIPATQGETNPLKFGVRCSDLAKLMETGRAEEGDKTLGADDKTAIKHLRNFDGVKGVLHMIHHLLPINNVVRSIQSQTFSLQLSFI